jgi:hypothetical protein
LSDEVLRHAFFGERLPDARGTEAPALRSHELLGGSRFGQPPAIGEIVEDARDLGGIFHMDAKLLFELAPRVLAPREEPQRTRCGARLVLPLASRRSNRCV